MSIINHGEKASQSAPATGQIAAEPPKSIATATKGQPRRARPGSGPVAESNDTQVDTETPNLTASTPAVSTRSKKVSKQDTVLVLLGQSEGATIDELMEATAWQAHSVRGFLSGTIRKKMNLHLISDVVGNGVRRYRVVPSDQAGGNSQAKGQLAAESPANLQGA